MRWCLELGLAASGTVGNRYLLLISHPERRNYRAGGVVTAAQTDQRLHPTAEKGVTNRERGNTRLSPEGLVGIGRQEQIRRFRNVQTDRHRGTDMNTGVHQEPLPVHRGT